MDKVQLWWEDFSFAQKGEVVADVFYAEQLRWFLFSPIAFGAGIAFYFSFPVEPTLAFALLLFLWMLLFAALILMLLGVDSLWVLLAVAGLIFALGFGASFYRTHSLTAPRIEKPAETNVVGIIQSIDITRNKKTQVWVLSPKAISAIAGEEMPKKIRLRLKPFSGRANFQAGDEVSLRALLFPPPRKALPEGFDPARHFWFKQLNGTGLVLSRPQKIKSHPPDFYQWLDRQRNAIAKKIEGTITHPSAAGIAAALIVGKRALISDAVGDKLRNTGLAHILAISGLHMAAFAGAVYFILRFMLALIPFFALRHPIKKWAMVPALLAAVVYLFLSGYSVSTQRAFVMFVIAGVAVLRGTNVLTLRNLAFAALVILALRPESLFNAGFQLSFAATLGIIASYERMRFRWFKRSAKDDSLTLLHRRIILGTATLFFTSLVAWAATAPFAVTHFNRLGFLPAIAANMLVLPVFTLWVMPSVVLAVLFLGIGYSEPVLIFLSQGLEVILFLVDWITQTIGTAHIIAAPPHFLLTLFIISGLWLCLWQGKLRWAGAAGVGLAFVLSLLFQTPRPDIIISEEIFAVRGTQNNLHPSRPSPWLVSQWLFADGDSRRPWQAYKEGKAVLLCDKNQCTTTHKGLKIIFVQPRGQLSCKGLQADIFIGKNCVGDRKTIRPKDLKQKGTHLLFIHPNKIEVQHARQEQRLWSRSF